MICFVYALVKKCRCIGNNPTITGFPELALMFTTLIILCISIFRKAIIILITTAGVRFKEFISL